MRRIFGQWLLVTIIAVYATADARAEMGARPVDVELVLAIDSSASISNHMLALQLAGYVAAFRDKPTIETILPRPDATVAVTLISWSSPGPVQTVVPWTVIASRDDAVRFAATIEAAPLNVETGTTAVGNLIEKAMELFGTGGLVGTRRIIDISSNGFSNAGIAPEPMRDAAVARGLTINALVILDEYSWLEEYYQNSVIGGPGAFVRVAQGQQDFAAALRQKLVEEISSAEAPPSVTVPAP